MVSMKSPMALAVSGVQTLPQQHRSRVKAKASFVDETLFGSPAGARLAPPDFDPPWVEKVNRTKGVGTAASRVSGARGSCETTSSRAGTPTLAPRKKNKYRLISHTPSYCDESLFGSRPKGTSWETPWMAKEDAAKLHTLFWTPPATPRGSHSPRPRETPVRAIHPNGPSKTEPGVAADARKLSVAASRISANWGCLPSACPTPCHVPGVTGPCDRL
ncbi:PREDICTED: RBPJ-interacting and tubulin-associated protein 1 isoform X2 [Condylura cristata]|uniref:RBPJ-interacting and tubulin-associated protein 1 isoform X2 n=1 Tax=Condylura cristata TaxID=143302 RepID=UPI00064395C3|nr:PREDICTED: RBPJ-interacting and tubulin-associated protein 1 isoform X2 [Condylura cristata]